MPDAVSSTRNLWSRLNAASGETWEVEPVRANEEWSNGNGSCGTEPDQIRSEVTKADGDLLPRRYSISKWRLHGLGGQDTWCQKRDLPYVVLVHSSRREMVIRPDGTPRVCKGS